MDTTHPDLIYKIMTFRAIAYVSHVNYMILRHVCNDTHEVVSLYVVLYKCLFLVRLETCLHKITTVLASHNDP